MRAPLEGAASGWPGHRLSAQPVCTPHTCRLGVSPGTRRWWRGHGPALDQPQDQYHQQDHDENANKQADQVAVHTVLQQGGAPGMPVVLRTVGEGTRICWCGSRRRATHQESSGTPQQRRRRLFWACERRRTRTIVTCRANRANISAGVSQGRCRIRNGNGPGPSFASLSTAAASS
jgi:hypothetical protein